MSRSRPKRLPPGARLRITTSAPVVIVRGPRSPDVFSYTDAQWAKVVAAHPACNQHQLLVDLEAAGPSAIRQAAAILDYDCKSGCHRRARR